MASPLSPRQLADFERDGYLVVPALVDAARLAALQAAHTELVTGWADTLGVPVDEYTRVVSQWTGLHLSHPVFAEQVRHPAVIAAARQLLDSPVQLFHDHLISKPAHASSTIPWHQDYPFWPVDRPRALSCWLALDDVPAEAGAMRFMPGAHREGEQPPVDFLRAPKVWGAREASACAVPVKAGDCIFHHCLSWHTSPPNQTAGPRRAYIAILLSTSCRFAPGHSAWHPMNEFVSVAPGEPMNTDHFPIL